MARAFQRDGRRWWAGTSAAVAVVATAILLVEGLFAGVEGALQERVEDVFTDDVRLTQRNDGVAPRDWWVDLDNASSVRAQAQAAAGPAARVQVQAESQYLLTRVSFLEAALNADEGLGVTGLNYDGPATFSLGVLVGLDLDGAPREQLRRYLVAGAIPSHADAASNPGTVDIVLSAPRFTGLLASDERDHFAGRLPTAQELRAYPFEITTAHVRPGGSIGDLVRLPARVVGLYETGVDAIDSLTAFVTIQDVRELAGYPPDGAVGNVLRVSGGDKDAVSTWANKNGLYATNAEGFLDRYLGQLLLVLRLSALMTASAFTGVAVVLAWQGSSRQVVRHWREILTANAIGVPMKVLERVFLLVALRALAVALVATGLAVAVLGQVVPYLVEPLIPLPIGFGWPGLPGVAVVAAVVVGVTWAAQRSVRAALRQPLAAGLRA